MKDKYDVILKEKPIDEGLGKTEIIEMLSNLKDEEIIPLEIEATKTDSKCNGIYYIPSGRNVKFLL